MTLTLWYPESRFTIIPNRPKEKQRFWLKSDWQEDFSEVTKEEYIKAERNAGFYPKYGDGVATAAFGSGSVRGRTFPPYDEKADSKRFTAAGKHLEYETDVIMIFQNIQRGYRHD